MSIELKIKAKTLAEESRIIKHERNKLKKKALNARLKQKPNLSWKILYTEWRLSEHNRLVVRSEARATNLARAFIKGLEYKRVENKTVEPFPWKLLDKVLKMVNKYHDKTVTIEDIEKWAK